MKYLADDQARKLEALERGRLEATGDPWRAAWDAAALAHEIEDRDFPAPSVDGMAACWYCLRIAEAAEQRLVAQGRSSAADTGETAADRIRIYIGSLACKIMEEG